MRPLTGLIFFFLLSMNPADELDFIAANSGVSEIDKIFEGKNIQIEIHYYGGINPGLLGKDILKISSKGNSTFAINYATWKGGNSSANFSQIEKNQLKALFKDLILDHHQSRIMMGNCTTLDKSYVLVGNGKRIEIKPNLFSQKQEILDAWFLQNFS